jgi:hypothetical protein
MLVGGFAQSTMEARSGKGTAVSTANACIRLQGKSKVPQYGGARRDGVVIRSPQQ